MKFINFWAAWMYSSYDYDMYSPGFLFTFYDWSHAYKSIYRYLKYTITYRNLRYSVDTSHASKFMYTKGKNYERLCKLGEAINQKIKEIDQSYHNYGIHSSVMYIDEWIR